MLYDIKSAIWGDERYQHQLKLDPNMPISVAHHKKEENRSLALSTGAIGLVLLGIWSPVFYMLGSIAVLYLARYAFWFSWQDIKKRHFMSIYLLTAIQTLGMIATGHLVLAAVGGISR